MKNSLSNQVAVVTGAGSGIGRAIAEALAAAGAILILVGRTRETLEETADVIEIGGGASRVSISPTNLTLDDQVERLRSQLEREFGRVDILVHSAGVIFRGKIENHNAQDFDRQYQANVRAPYLLTQALLPLLKIRPGQIVVINSSVGLRAGAGVSQFSATQHALKAITDSLREEVNPDGIRVLSVFPGRTATPRQATLYKLSGQEYRPHLLLQPQDIASIVTAALSLSPTAEITDIHTRPLIKSY